MSSPRLTSTSYVVLGLLCTRPWSAYELTQQMERGWNDVWPRAVRGIYEEPKKLEAHGHATSWTERRGGRTRTVYDATEEGRDAFRRWLTEPPQPPAFESEALVRVLFADQVSLEDLRQAIRAVREHAETRIAALQAQGAEYLAGGGPFPGRVHLLHLVGAFLGEQLVAMLRWADWADAEVSTWQGVGISGVPDIDRLGREVAAVFEQQSPRLRTTQDESPGHLAEEG